MVYGQLRWNVGRNWNVDNGQPYFNHDILRPVGDGKLRELDLRDDIGDGQSTAGGSDVRVGEPGSNLRRRLVNAVGDTR